MKPLTVGAGFKGIKAGQSAHEFAVSFAGFDLLQYGLQDFIVQAHRDRMNIDLLFTARGEAGLLSSQNFIKKLVGVVFDVKGGLLSLEFADMDHMDLNIPVEEEFYPRLDLCPQIHIGAVKGGKIAQAYQVPFMFLDDPYRAEAFRNVRTPKRPLEAFHYFVKSCVLGQPVHREDAGDESTLGCILGEALPSSLEFAPHLARRHTMEISPSIAPSPNAPGMGLGGSGGGGRSGGYTRGGRSAPKQNNDEEDD